MSKNLVALVAGCLSTFCLSTFAVLDAPAATVTFHSPVLTHPTQAMVDSSAGGLTLGSQIVSFYVTTDADILSVNQVRVVLSSGATLFQVSAPFGSDLTPPDEVFIAFNPSLAADSWINTPGSTSRLGTNLPGDGTGSWGDLTNDGPQSYFQIARLTVPANATGRFEGRVSVAGVNGPEAYPFAWVPEPASSGLLAVALIALARFRRS
jgi:hypothetical protein